MVVLLFSCSGLNAQCDTFEMDVVVTNTTCNGFADGSITISTTGGNGSIYYTVLDWGASIISVSPGTGFILPPGWYDCHVEDDSLCILTESVYVGEAPAILPQMIYTQPSSIGACDGIAEVDTVLDYQGSYSSLSYFWTPGGPSGIGETIKTDLCDDYYTLIINDEFGCSAVLDFAMGSASIDADKISTKMSLFPNPSSETQTLTFPLDQQTNGTVLLSDVDGRIVKTVFDGHFQSGITNLTVSLSDIPAGIYIYSILLGDKTQHLRTLKE